MKLVGDFVWLQSVHCFDIIGWMRETTSVLKKLMSLIPTGFFLEQAKDNNWERTG